MIHTKLLLAGLGLLATAPAFADLSEPQAPNPENPALVDPSLDLERPYDQVRIYGGRRNGYDTAYCPNGYRIQSCSFNYNTCDNTSQGYNYCSADSRNHQYCQFSGVCVQYNYEEEADFDRAP
jgi:hypothetical protein